MSNNFYCTLLLIFCLFGVYADIRILPTTTNACVENSFTCRLTHLLRQFINKLQIREEPLLLAPGLEIVKVKYASARNLSQVNNDSLFACFSAYLHSHEINIKLNELLRNIQIMDLAVNGDGMKEHYNAEPRKKDKSQGLIVAMSVMFAKMMAVFGIGGIGLLALKALGVASAALMMAVMIGLKSLAQQYENPHSVQYVTSDAHHHKRRRR